MKKQTSFYLFLFISIFFGTHTLHAQWNKKEALRVINRFTDQQLPLKLYDLPKNDGKDQYEISVENGKVKIKASSGVAACRAFYD
ncbi:MAG: alpha-N-acetylglucosaminidase N-terminal domain-containing protein, partial [Bacteroidales bacterium]